MKKNFVIFNLAFIMLTSLSAQTFQPLHDIQLPFEPDVIVHEHTGDFKYFLSSTEKEMAMVDGIEGKLLWKLNLTELTGSKKIVNQFWNKDANVILVFNEDSKRE